MKPLLLVTKQGVYGSLQDQGRYGYRSFGIPLSGPMDKVSFQAAQQILQNHPDQTSFEMFVGGFEFEALSDGMYVLTGGHCTCLVNNDPIEMWKTFRLTKGDQLAIKSVHQGSIVYLTPLGGFYTKKELGSSSCLPLGNLGTSITKGSILYGQITSPLTYNRGLYAPYRPTFLSTISVRIFKGPHFHLFTEESQRQFLHNPFQFIGGNRMGYYIKGPVLQLHEMQDILSEATQFGTIQVPQSGDPIILMADAQTVGGYPIIATVHEGDLHKVAQMRTFNTIQFALEEA
ncbi:biotin-dependent carboxyltransferase family protein [Lysinibacillus cavernae]|uniref:5-oxoprolinase subunit C family protein n=1 Tax=Lysinibacillus cavernae TaxID=2666135 RepID=UPI0012D95CD2|nr:biotin-dependent carboxyltransferase family protein [Lysinibacillus cavernae]